MLDKKTASDLAKEFKIEPFTIYREYLQLVFLKHFYEQKYTEKIYFKGGTALRLVFKSFRFSEDLDFTSLIEEERVVDIINKTIINIQREIPGLSFKKLDSLAGFSGKIYQEIKEFNFPLTIKLDFSFMEKPVNTTTSYVETVFPISPYPYISHFTIEEILAEKIRALLSRAKGRDLFDFWFILSKNIKLDWKLVYKKMEIYKQKLNKKIDKPDKKDLIQKINSFPQKNIDQDLSKFLPLNHRAVIKDIKSLVLQKL